MIYRKLPFPQLLIIGLVAFVFFLVSCNAVHKKSDQSPKINNKKQNGSKTVNVFVRGERIELGIYSYGVKVGSGSLEYAGESIIDNQKFQRVIFNASSFSINDTEDILGTEDFAFPVEVKREVSRLGKKEIIREKYSADRKTVRIFKTIGKKTEQPKVISNEEGLNNILLFIYRLRNDGDLRIGKTYKVVLPTASLDLEVKKKAVIKVPLGKIEVYCVESNPSKYRIWLTCDEKRLPVKIQGVVGAGMVYMAATEIKS